VRRRGAGVGCRPRALSWRALWRRAGEGAGVEGAAGCAAGGRRRGRGGGGALTAGEGDDAAGRGRERGGGDVTTWKRQRRGIVRE
jgi:hypothetical protein